MNSAEMELYWRSPVWIQNLLSSIKGYQLRRLRYGGVFEQELETLEKSQWFSAGEFIGLQNELLKRTIFHAYGSVPYYRKLFDDLKLHPSEFRSKDDLQKLPILTKKNVRDLFKQLISTSIPRRSIIFYSTSGSTGSPLPLACDAATLQKDWAHMWSAYRRFGVDFHARGAHFPGKVIVPAEQKRPPFWRSNFIANQKIFSVFHIGSATVRYYLDELNRWGAEYWYGYASAMALLCKHAEVIGRVLVPPPKAIFAGSESLYPRDREIMKGVGQCKVMSGYGSQEYVCRIMECEQGSFHLNPEYGIMEIIGDNGLPAKTGRLIATGFANKVMPLIRYDTGDLAEWADTPCACGRESPIVGRIVGRIEDHILTPEGLTIGHIPVRHFLSTNIIESQIYQPDLHNIVMRIVKDSKYTTKDEASMLQGLRKMVGPSLNIRFEYMETLPRTIGGKLRAIVSDVNQNYFQGGC